MPRIKVKSDRRHLDTARKHYVDARKSLDELATGRPGGRLHPQHLMRVINEKAADDAIFTPDVGLPIVWAARYLTMNGKRRLIGSYWHGSMANAMPQAIGAQAASPGRQVISLSGDGGFTMLMGDLLSLTQLKLPVKVFVFNNGALGFIELEQKSAGFLPFGTDLVNPNFAQMAEAIGIKGIRIEDPKDVEAGVAEALAHPGPVVVDAVVAREELAMPPAVTVEMAKGFSLYMLKAILSGRGDEIVELARKNFRTRSGPFMMLGEVHIQMPSAQPSLRGSEPPSSVPRSQSIQIACAPPIGQAGGCTTKPRASSAAPCSRSGRCSISTCSCPETGTAAAGRSRSAGPAGNRTAWRANGHGPSPDSGRPSRRTACTRGRSRRPCRG